MDAFEGVAGAHGTSRSPRWGGDKVYPPERLPRGCGGFRWRGAPPPPKAHNRAWRSGRPEQGRGSDRSSGKRGTTCCESANRRLRVSINHDTRLHYFIRPIPSSPELNRDATAYARSHSKADFRLVRLSDPDGSWVRTGRDDKLGSNRYHTIRQPNTAWSRARFPRAEDSRQSNSRELRRHHDCPRTGTSWRRSHLSWDKYGRGFNFCGKLRRRHEETNRALCGPSISERRFEDRCDDRR
ncbi:hypothetical protein Pla175_14530 [Pirellulimonas nuda]|uniref:Uncharacterized protein n=1 Tax=Pirellulimonas nuda TaxID=2528009 RepID=A0A518D9H1_9BACT|nr:hypothetical protein Pla175_14530 [Pirellulimonas nuda]